MGQRRCLARPAIFTARLGMPPVQEHLLRSGRTENLDCVARHARGCDRFDGEVLSSAFHEDGIDEHGYAINPGWKYSEWANEAHTRGSLQNMHNITTHLCEIDGDEATGRVAHELARWEKLLK